MGRLWATVLSLSLGLVLVPTAMAGTPGHWTRITDMTASNIDEVTLARTGDGVLHAAWSRPTPSNPGAGRDLLELPISAGGAAGSPMLVAGNWATMANPYLVATGGSGLDLFLGATRSTNFDETVANLALFTSPDGGQTWALDPADLTKTGAAYASNVAAALASDGTPFETWGSSSCLCVHRGLSQASANADFQQGLGDFGYEPGMAFDPATGQLVVAWYSNGTGHDGIYAAQVDPGSGGVAGAQLPMPGTGNVLDGPFSGRTPIVARPGGGMYVAYEGGYPSHAKVLLWRVGAGGSAVLAKDSRGVTSVGIASTPAGRLWVFWSARNSNGTPLVYARRSNPGASVWGPAVVASPPSGATTSWNLVGNGQADPLDLVGSFSLGSSSQAASWHTQILPGLALTASAAHLPAHRAHAQHVTFFVSDAGAPVSGATVRVGKAKGTTNAKGKVKLALGPFGHKGQLVGGASANGYADASLVLRIS